MLVFALAVRSVEKTALGWPNANKTILEIMYHYKNNTKPVSSLPSRYTDYLYFDYFFHATGLYKV